MRRRHRKHWAVIGAKPRRLLSQLSKNRNILFYLKKKKVIIIILEEKEEMECQWRPLVTRKATTKRRREKKIEAKGKMEKQKKPKGNRNRCNLRPVLLLFLLPCDALFRRPVPSGRARRFVQESTRPNPIKMFRLVFFFACALYSRVVVLLVVIVVVVVAA